MWNLNDKKGQIETNYVKKGCVECYCGSNDVKKVLNFI
jgi:hypothetical protein